MRGIFCIIVIVVPIILLGVAISRREQRSLASELENELVRDSPWQPALRAAIASYGLFALVIALSAAVFFLWPSTITALLAAFSTSPDSNRAVYMFGNVAVGFILLLVVLVSEPYLRGSETQAIRFRRFIQVAAGLVGFGVLAWGLRIWAISLL